MSSTVPMHGIGGCPFVSSSWLRRAPCLTSTVIGVTKYESHVCRFSSGGFGYHLSLNHKQTSKINFLCTIATQSKNRTSPFKNLVTGRFIKYHAARTRYSLLRNPWQTGRVRLHFRTHQFEAFLLKRNDPQRSMTE
jgi:hypothetical protein